MISLGIDTSNYATSLAVYDSGENKVLCAVKRFLPVKEGELGLRQSDAVFHHVNALPSLLEELALQTDLSRVEVVGVSKTPRPQPGSYMPCFLAGLGFATAFARGKGCGLKTTSHQQGHLAAALYGAGFPFLPGQPFLFFHVSGGTTELHTAKHFCVNQKMGESLDLYAGQAVDRLGVGLGHPFPAGEKVSELALGCHEAVRPKSSLKDGNCHLSGLQNQCEKMLEDGSAPECVAKFCLLCIADSMAKMAAYARGNCGDIPLLCAGGVAASEVIREYLRGKLKNVYFAPAKYSSDNAVGVAIIAAAEESNG